MRPASVGFQCPDDAREGARSIRAPRTVVGAPVRGGTPVATYTLVGLNLLVYFITGAQAGSLTDPGRTNFNGWASQLFGDWVMVPWYVYQNHEYYRLITSAFLHLSPLHIVGNMLALVIIGPPVEHLVGRWRFVAVYVLAGFGGGAAIYLFGSVLGPVGGASGAIFGLFGMCLVMVRRLGLNPTWLVSTIVINLVLTFSVPGISALGHLGGLVVGALCALAIGGWPTSARRLSQQNQLLGLGGIAVLIIVAVGVRTAVGMSLT